METRLIQKKIIKELDFFKIGRLPLKNSKTFEFFLACISYLPFLSNLSNAKNLIFLAFLTQKLAPSNVLNGIIFAIDEQCNLIFETALFTNCKPYIIFLFSGAH